MYGSYLPTRRHGLGHEPQGDPHRTAQTPAIRAA